MIPKGKSVNDLLEEAALADTYKFPMNRSRASTQLTNELAHGVDRVVMFPVLLRIRGTIGADR